MEEDGKEVPPKVDPKSKTPEPKETEAKPDSVETVSVDDFKELQMQFMKLQESNTSLVEEKKEIQRTAKLAEINKLNPKLAEINKNAGTSTLDVVLKTAQELKGEFPPLDDGKEGSKSSKQSLIGYKLLNSEKWITKGIE